MRGSAHLSPQLPPAACIACGGYDVYCLAVSETSSLPFFMYVPTYFPTYTLVRVSI